MSSVAVAHKADKSYVDAAVAAVVAQIPVVSGFASAVHNHDGVYQPAGSYAAASHNHAGVYEPVLGNPGTNGFILSSTTSGVRSWIAPTAGGAGQAVGMATVNGTLALALASNINAKATPTATGTFTTTVPAAGVRCTVIVIQSNTTAKTMTFGTGFKPVGTLVLGTTANRQFAVSFISDGANLIETGRTAAMPV